MIPADSSATENALGEKTQSDDSKEGKVNGQEVELAESAAPLSAGDMATESSTPQEAENEKLQSEDSDTRKRKFDGHAGGDWMEVAVPPSSENMQKKSIAPADAENQNFQSDDLGPNKPANGDAAPSLEVGSARLSEGKIQTESSTQEENPQRNGSDMKGLKVDELAETDLAEAAPPSAEKNRTESAIDADNQKPQNEDPGMKKEDIDFMADSEESAAPSAAKTPTESNVPANTEAVSQNTGSEHSDSDQPKLKDKVAAESEEGVVQPPAGKMTTESSVAKGAENEKDWGKTEPAFDECTAGNLEEGAVSDSAGKMQTEPIVPADAENMKPHNDDSGSKKRKFDEHMARDVSGIAEVAFTTYGKNSIPSSRQCMAEGCKKYKEGRCDGYCMEHFKVLADLESIKIVLAFKKCKTEGCSRNKIASCQGFCSLCFTENSRDSDPVIKAADKVPKTKVALTSTSVKKAKVTLTSTSPKRAKVISASTSAKKANATPASTSAKKANATPAFTSAKNAKGIPCSTSAKKAKATLASTSAKKAKVTPAPTSAKSGATKTKTRKKKSCKMEGCEKHARSNLDGYCIGHSKFLSQLSVPLPTPKSQLEKSLKPILKGGSAIYAAYWPPDDPKRVTEPSWYPGVVSTCKVSVTPADEKYGSVRYYDVKYDDGDKLNKIPDHFVFAEEDYLLHLCLDGKSTGTKKASWIGVKNVTDRRSKDQWAKCVGWYVATIEGGNYSFPRLSDALKAYDVSVVRSKGVKTAESELNIPEDWEGLFSGQNETPPKSNSPAATKGGKSKDNKAAKEETQKCTKAAKVVTSKGNKAPKGVTPRGNRTSRREKFIDHEPAQGGKSDENKPAQEGKPEDDKSAKVEKSKGKKTSELLTSQIKSKPAAKIGPGWTREFRLTPLGASRSEFISPSGIRFKSVVDATKFMKAQKQQKTENATEGALSTEASKPAAAHSSNDTPQNLKRWTPEETQLVIKLDEQYAGYKHGEKCNKMAEKLPRWDAKGCGTKIQKLRKEVVSGRGIGPMLDLTDIKTTLSKWTKEEIDLLMKIEQQYHDKEEDEKNKEIAQAIPRWDGEKCSFKTLFMRWETRLLQEAEVKKRKKEEAATRKGKREEIAFTKLSGDEDATNAKAMAASGKEDDGPPPGIVTVTPHPKKHRIVPSSFGTPTELKLDKKFVEILNNDPYLLSRCDPKTMDALEKAKSNSE